METQQGTHVVIFPLPLQGPINCMLSLADLILALSEATISVTFITTNAVATCLTRHSDIGARFAKYGPRFSLESVPDGLGPDDNDLPGAHQVSDLIDSLATQAVDAGSRLREVLTYGGLWGQPDRRPVTCIIADGPFWFMVDVTKELRVPLVYFETISPSALWTYLCVPKIVQAGELPFKGDDLDAQITSVPGMEGYLRCRDLPSFFRAYDPNHQITQRIWGQALCYPRAQGHILNTFEDLEAPLLSHMRDLCPNLYTIGPRHSLLRARVEPTASKTASSSLWEEDQNCLAWLDAQPSMSVLYVSIGSLAVMTRDQLMEFWYGLVNSKTRFLWVRRPGSIIETGHDDEVPMELEEGTRERGRLVSWVPQEEVLGHRAIGGFLTHSGWNSTLESIAAGVPMICWPVFVDQQVNSRMVSKVWGVGLDMKDTCDRVIIEKMIRDLMGDQRKRFAAKMDKLSKLAAKAVEEGGTSYCNLNRLIDDIQFNRFPIPS